MKKTFAVMVLMVVMFLCSMVQAFDGRPAHGSLGQLPPDKETLFHQTMRGVWDATANIHEQIKGLEAEINSILTAREFKEALFLEKAKRLQELHKTAGEAMDRAIAKLASQFTIKERSMLAEIISHKPGSPAPGGPDTPRGRRPPGDPGAFGGPPAPPGPPPGR